MQTIRRSALAVAGIMALLLVVPSAAVAAGTTPDELSEPRTICRAAGGIWLAQYRECSRMRAGKRWCEANSGKFDPCASACRHKPAATACIMVCVPTCTF